MAQDYKIDKCINDEKKLVSVVRNPKGPLKNPIAISKSPESSHKKSTWLERSKAHRKAQEGGFENWGNIDHEDFNFDLDNDPYLDLIPEWRKEKLLERKNNKINQGYSGKYNVFNENKDENIKLNISN